MTVFFYTETLPSPLRRRNSCVRLLHFAAATSCPFARVFASAALFLALRHPRVPLFLSPLDFSEIKALPMVGDLQIMEAGTEKMAKKGKFSKRSSKSNKKFKPLGGAVKKAKKPSKKMIKLFRKRARAYNSDEDEEETAPDAMQSLHEDSSDDGSEGYNGSDDENEGDRYGTHRGITRFTEGCRAFRTAFLNIMKKNLQNDPLGPILSANRKLVAEKLAEEGIEQKAKAEAKKDKHLAAKTGHVMPASFLDTKEKLLISVATKGVVKLFNAVNKAQSSQNGLNPSNSKDAKALAKQRKATFLSDIKKSTERNLENATKVHHMNKADDDEPAWAPLRDSYMLTSSKLKDWDKMENPASVGEVNNMSSESSDGN